MTHELIKLLTPDQIQAFEPNFQINELGMNLTLEYDKSGRFVVPYMQFYELRFESVGDTHNLDKLVPTINNPGLYSKSSDLQPDELLIFVQCATHFAPDSELTQKLISESVRYLDELKSWHREQITLLDQTQQRIINL